MTLFTMYDMANQMAEFARGGRTAQQRAGDQKRAQKLRGRRRGGGKKRTLGETALRYAGAGAAGGALVGGVGGAIIGNRTGDDLTPPNTPPEIRKANKIGGTIGGAIGGGATMGLNSALIGGGIGAIAHQLGKKRGTAKKRKRRR